ncbi:ankyrin-3 [Biomphalaria glabrata]|nr:ankyrin-3 [Biomphalaria glabrata]
MREGGSRLPTIALNHFAFVSGYQNAVMNLIDKNIMDKGIHSTPPKPRCMKREYGARENHQGWREQVMNVKKNLMSAIDRGDHVTVSNIIGSQVHVTTHSGRKIVNQAFVRACLAGKEQIVSLLLCKGADVNEVSKDDMTPLKAAILSNSYSVVELLLKCGASVKTHTRHREDSILHLALKRGFLPDPVIGADKWEVKYMTDTNIIKLLIDNGALVNQACTDGYLPLSLAASAKRDSVVSHLIKKGADVNRVDTRYGMAPLMHAAIAGNVHIVKLLLKYGAKLDITDKWDYSPLMLAAQFKSHLVVSCLIQGGADVNKVSEFDGKSPLILATESNCCDTMQALLQHGAHVNYSKPFHKRGTTALMIAAKLGSSEAVNILLSYKADASLRDEDCATAFSLCSDQEIVNLINII